MLFYAVFEPILVFVEHVGDQNTEEEVDANHEVDYKEEHHIEVLVVSRKHNVWIVGGS